MAHHAVGFHASYAPPAKTPRQLHPPYTQLRAMSDLGFNIWGAITGAIGIMTLLPAARIDMQLPSRKIVALKTFMNETQTLFKNDLEEGLHIHEDELSQFSTRILIRIDDVAYDVDMLQDWGALVKGWWDGVTEVIQSLHADVNRLRNKLVVRRSVCIREHMILITIRFSKAVLETDSGWQLKATPKGWQERRMSIMALAQPGSDPEILKDYADVALPDNSEVYLARVHSPIPHPRMSAQMAPHAAGPSRSHNRGKPPASRSLESRPSQTPKTSRIRGKQREHRTLRRSVLYRFSQKSYDVPIPHALDHEHGPSPRRRRHCDRIKELFQEIYRLLNEEAHRDDVYGDNHADQV
ncbi:hypothetical protein BC628DRAFT_1337879 [Trametes gibbosa]|nr:hypothetical protein BC628DRAFT_1457917 [Trametes gibbosa]KAI0828228.1 hypothetical protein BC628DRAFT_1337879 [Trametes gibbosa]